MKGFSDSGQYNDIFSTEIKEPIMNRDNPKKRFTSRQVEAARGRGLLEPELMKEAKVRFRLEAFASLDDDTVEYVFEKYKTDFDLFDFEEETKALRNRVRGL